MRDTQRSEIISTQLRQIAEQAIEHPDRVFKTLIHRMDVDFLREAYLSLSNTFIRKSVTLTDAEDSQSLLGLSDFIW